MGAEQSDAADDQYQACILGPVVAAASLPSSQAGCVHGAASTRSISLRVIAPGDRDLSVATRFEGIDIGGVLRATGGSLVAQERFTAQEADAVATKGAFHSINDQASSHSTPLMALVTRIWTGGTPICSIRRGGPRPRGTQPHGQSTIRQTRRSLARTSIDLPPEVFDSGDAFRWRTREPVAQRRPRPLVLVE